MTAQQSPTYVLRSLLFVPGHRPRFIERPPDVPTGGGGFFADTFAVAEHDGTDSEPA